MPVAPKVVVKSIVKPTGEARYRPVMMAVWALPSIPSVTCSAVLPAQNPDSPFPPNLHMASFWYFGLIINISLEAIQQNFSF